MVRDFLTALVVIAATIQLTGALTRSQPPATQPPPPTPTSPANQTTSGNQTASSVTTQSVDPAAVMFTTGAGMVLHAVKRTGTADYEAVILALQSAFAQSTDEEVRRVADGWRVWKAAEPDAGGNVTYVHTYLPALGDVDYRPSLWLDQLLAGAPAELLAKYRDSFAVAPSKLSLTELAHMSVAPATPANVTPAKPGNGSPR